MGNTMFVLACISVLISPSVYTFFFLLTSELWKSLSTMFIIDSAYLTAVPLGKQNSNIQEMLQPVWLSQDMTSFLCVQYMVSARVPAGTPRRQVPDTSDTGCSLPDVPYPPGQIGEEYWRDVVEQLVLPKFLTVFVPWNEWRTPLQNRLGLCTAHPVTT